MAVQVRRSGSHFGRRVAFSKLRIPFSHHQASQAGIWELHVIEIMPSPIETIPPFWVYRYMLFLLLYLLFRSWKGKTGCLEHQTSAHAGKYRNTSKQFLVCFQHESCKYILRCFDLWCIHWGTPNTLSQSSCLHPSLGQVSDH